MGRAQGAGDIGESNVATWHDFIAHTKTHALKLSYRCPGYATTTGRVLPDGLMRVVI